MEAQTVLCCSRGLKEIHLLLLFTKFASQLQAELLNVTVSYEEKREGWGGEKGWMCRGKEGLRRNGNLSLRSQDNHCEPVPESFVSGKGSKWSILCLAEH